jgi:hypothetical protein
LDQRLIARRVMRGEVMKSDMPNEVLNFRELDFTPHDIRSITVTLKTDNSPSLFFIYKNHAALPSLKQ